MISSMPDQTIAPEEVVTVKEKDRTAKTTKRKRRHKKGNNENGNNSGGGNKFNGKCAITARGLVIAPMNVERRKPKRVTEELRGQLWQLMKK